MPRDGRAAPGDLSRVVLVSDGRAWTGPGWTDYDLDGVRLREMIVRALTQLTGREQVGQAISDLFPGPDMAQQRFGIKVNCVNEALPSHPKVAMGMAQLLVESGVPAENILIFDRLNADLADCGFEPNDQTGLQVYGSNQPGTGYDPEGHEFSHGTIRLAAIVSSQVDHLINLPVLKNHEMAGITGALKNHFGSIDRPMALHSPTRECCPGIAELNALPAIRDKTRLVLVDACFGTYAAGLAGKPEFAPMAVMASRDPVAADSVCQQIINERRAEAGMAAIDARHIREAAAVGLGRADGESIDRQDVEFAPVVEKPKPWIVKKSNSGCSQDPGPGSDGLTGLTILASLAAGRIILRK